MDSSELTVEGLVMLYNEVQKTNTYLQFFTVILIFGIAVFLAKYIYKFFKIFF